jgi:hypothetical protein
MAGFFTLDSKWEMLTKLFLTELNPLLGVAKQKGLSCEYHPKFT